MRNSTPIILWVLIFSFGILWVLQDTQVFDSMAGGPQFLGSVNGDQITTQEFNSRVSYYIDQYNQQTNGASLTQEMRNNIEEQAWNDLVSERLMIQKIEELGITVSDEEVVSMITGENPDPFIRQQFQDETGAIDRIALRAAIEAPENSEVWMTIEQQLRQNRQQQKLSNFITSGLRVSNIDVEQAYVNQNSYGNITFVRFPYGDISMDEVRFTESDLLNYYDANRELYERDESYRFRYVTFDKMATAEDTMRTIEDIERLIPLFEQEEDDHAGFLQRNDSQTAFQDAFVLVDEIREEYRPVIDLGVGEVSEVTMINGDPYVFKKIEQDGDEIKFAVLSFNVIADPVATIDRLADEADEFSFFAQEESFESEAGQQGLEIYESTATKGNPVIPGIGNARSLVNELERMGRNDISEPVELADMFVVVQLLETTSAGVRPFEEVRAQIENVVRDQKRRELALEQVREQMSNNPTIGELAESAGKEVQTAANVGMSDNTISGAGREPGVIGTIFGLSAGEQSGAIEGENAVFVLRVNELDIADPATMTQENRDAIKESLVQQKVAVFNQIWLEELTEEADIQDNRHLLL